MESKKETFLPFLQGGGEIGELIRHFDWSTTSIGTPDQWPQSLRISLGIVLNSGFPMFLFWGDDLTCFYNDAFRPSLGVDGKHPAIGKKGKEVWAEIWDFIGPQIDGVMKAGKPVWFENQLVPFYRNGGLENIYWTFSYSLILNEDGQSGGVLVTCVETTGIVNKTKKATESEERFRTLADDSPMFVFIIDADPSAPVSYWNKTWLQYTGQTLEEASGRAWNGIIHPDDIPIVMEHYAPAFESRTSYFIPAVRVKRHDNVYRWHSFKGNPRFLPNGAFDGYVGVGFDVHEQKITEEKLEEIVAERTAELQGINKELQRSNQNLEEFAHAASHDLKEPIRKIHFFTDQLRSQLSERLNESEKHTFNRIENASKRMGALIDDLLLFSHVSSKPHAKEVVDLNERVKRVLEDLELEIQLKSATITINPLPIVKGYRRQLQQLFQNLIGNALKYSKPGVAPIITITSTELVDENAWLKLPEAGQQKLFYCIEVKDNGIGFEQNEAERIFHMFHRLHGNAEYRGTGVGLSIARKVVENHNGKIIADSEPGMGAAFKVYLPV
jgi:PAS domain S-box-containing protein